MNDAHDNGASDNPRYDNAGNQEPRPLTSQERARYLAIILRQQMHEDAVASVALDLEGDVHTCHAECQHPACVARRERDAQTDSGEAS